MADRELLEMAALATELKSTGWINETHDWFQRDGVGYDDSNDCQQLWNPLTDDGDAFRLAVKLNITITFSSYRMGHQSSMPGMVWAQSELANINCASEWQLNDPYAATRRAIVRAAAEIGKAMAQGDKPRLKATGAPE